MIVKKGRFIYHSCSSWQQVLCGCCLDCSYSMTWKIRVNRQHLLFQGLTSVLADTTVEQLTLKVCPKATTRKVKLAFAVPD